MNQKGEYIAEDSHEFKEIINPYYNVQKEEVIICIVDYEMKTFLYKSEDFEAHSDRIDSLIFDPRLGHFQ